MNESKSQLNALLPDKTKKINFRDRGQGQCNNNKVIIYEEKKLIIVKTS